MLRKVMVAGVIGLSLVLTGCVQSNPVPGRTVKALVSVQASAPQQNYEIHVIDAQGYTRFTAALAAGRQVSASVPASTSYRFVLYRTSTQTNSKPVKRAQICAVTTASQADSIRFTTNGANCDIH